MIGAFMNLRAWILPGLAALLAAAPGCSLSTPDRYDPDRIDDAAQDSRDLDVGTDLPPDTPVDPPPDSPPLDVLQDPVDADRPDVHDPPADEVVSCIPGSASCNDDSDLQVCNPDGSGVTVEPCAFGCSAVPEPHCLAFVPSNVADRSLLCMDGLTAPALTPGAQYVVADTETGGIYQLDGEGNFMPPMIREEGEGLDSGIHFSVQAQPEEAPALGIFSLQALTVPAGVALMGIGDNALVILSCGDVIIQGYIVAGSVVVTDEYGNRYVVPGPGGFRSGLGPGAGGDGGSGSSSTSGGGGGAGFGGPGGAGAAGVYYSSVAAGGAGGEPYGRPELVPLFGGSGGGLGAGNTGSYGYGGPAGGALQVSTPASIAIQPGAAVEACGWGGIGARPGGAGGGAGSGGGILLEAHTLTLAAGCVVAANGGGGGSSGQWSMTYGNSGEKGIVGLEPAPGGEAPTDAACAGGMGNSAVDVAGLTAPCEGVDGGGGGAGAGRIRLNAAVHVVDANTTSPSLSAMPTSTTMGDPMVE